MQHTLVVTTFASFPEAEKTIAGALENRLAACAQRVKIESDYWWQGKVEHAVEVLVQFKTRKTLAEPLKQYILNNHSDKTPQVVFYDIVGGHAPYLRWIDDETAGGRL